MIVASIDIGTNTVLLLIAEINNEKRFIKPILNEYRIPRIGKGLFPGLPISEEKVSELIEILSEYKNIAKKFNCKKIILTATHAFRIASNAKEIITRIKQLLNLEIKVITGNEEAKYSFLGVTSTLDKHSNVLVIDVGGGSTEIVMGKNNEIFFSGSFKIGAVSATERFLHNYVPRKNEIGEMEKEIQNIFLKLTEFKFIPDYAIAIAGTPTTLACINFGLETFQEDKIEGSLLNINEMSSLVNEISKMSSESILAKYKSVVKGREDVLFAGSFILLNLMKILRLEKISVSSKGIRYGAIVQLFFNSN